MFYYKRKLTYADLMPLIKELRTYLSENAILVSPQTEETLETFLVTSKNKEIVPREYAAQYIALVSAKMLYMVPFNNDETKYLVCFDQQASGIEPTVSPSHVRLPKLSYLTTLTAEDFFKFITLISTAKNTASNDSLRLFPSTINLQSIQSSIFEPFFVLLRTNWRFNLEYAAPRWTPRKALTFLSSLFPSKENQLAALQYLIAVQGENTLYFPADTSVELELDWPQISSTYCRQ